jgi:hypothetical protein
MQRAADRELRLMMSPQLQRRSSNLASDVQGLTRTRSGGEHAAKLTSGVDAQLKHQSNIDINPDEGSFFHAMISYRVRPARPSVRFCSILGNILRRLPQTQRL